MTDFVSLKREVQTHLGPHAGVGVTDPLASATGLLPAETEATVRMRDKRLREFAAGRCAARQAMSMIGAPAAPVPMGSDRAPCWPVGLVGSITHCSRAALAVIARHGTLRSVGIDLEEVEPLEHDLWDTILTPREQEHACDGFAAKRMFCAKEAVYKAQYPLTGRPLSFDDVELAFDGSNFTAYVRAGQGGGSVSTSGTVIQAQDLFVSIVVMQ